jgi:putative ABC transport system permease protein
MFSIANSVLLRPLPYRDPDHLVSISGINRERGLTGVLVSFTRVEQVQAQSHTLEALAGYLPTSSNLGTRGIPEQINSALTMRGLFDLLNASPAMGRNFTAQEDQPGGANVAIISDGFWHSHFGARPDILGQSVVLDAKSVAIVGVLPASFQFPFVQPAPDVWFPRVFENSILTHTQVTSGAGFLTVYARLRPGQTLASAQAELDAIDRNYKLEFPGFADAKNLTLSAALLKETLVGPVRVPLLVLLAAVSFLLLVGCTNLAGLLLSRATARRKEIAIRNALGASRARLVRQLLTESLFLSFLGGGIAILLSSWSLTFLRMLPTGALPRLEEVRIDERVLLFSVVLCLLTGVAFGLVPSLQTSKGGLYEALKESARGSSGGVRGGRSRSILVVTEVALALILICTSGLLVKSFSNLLRVNPGFDPKNVMTFGISLPQSRYPQPAAQAEFYRRFVESVRAIPNVESAGVVSFLPIGGTFRFVYVCPEGTVCQGIGKDPIIAVRQISPDYFKAMRIRLLRGRPFDEFDKTSSRNVVIINDTAAKEFFPGQDPIGKHLLQSRGNIQGEIVGVVASVHFTGLSTPYLGEMYLPQEQSPWASMALVVRSESAPRPIVDSVRAALANLDSDLPLSNILSMEDVLAVSVAQPRLTAKVTAAFSGLALLLAALGIYGVTAYSVTQRKQEIAIRMALGASPSKILMLMTRQGMKLVAIGVAIGLVGSIAFTRVLSSILFQLSARDPLTLASVTIFLIGVAAIACYVPALRATRVDPVTALRSE